MERKEFKIEGYNYIFRFAKMNALEILALQTQYSFKDFNDSLSTITYVLEHVEVKVNGETWIPVKIKDKNVFTPDIIETEVKLIAGIMDEFSKEIINPVFQNSEE